MLKMEEPIYFNRPFHMFSSSCVRFTSREQQHSREVNIYIYVCVYIYIIICDAYLWIILTPKLFYSSPQEKTSKKRSRVLEDDEYSDEEDGISLLDIC